jgi:[ribosomal protein S5]-alanine N-acetyltransferase
MELLGERRGNGNEKGCSLIPGSPRGQRTAKGLDKRWWGSLNQSVNAQPTLETERLFLRPLTPDDAPDIARRAGRREIADTTISIPHPYSEEQARQWIAGNVDLFARGKSAVFGMELKRERTLVGSIGLREIDAEHSQAELGYWIAVEWWGRGYATEAVRAVVDFGFRQLGLNRIYAHHMVRNPASGRVLAKIGMKQEGLLRQQSKKWGVFEDVVLLAVLRDEWAG